MGLSRLGRLLVLTASGVLHAAAAADPASPEACDAEDGAALLQHSPNVSPRKPSSISEVARGARVTEHGGARIVVHEDAEVGEGKTNSWVMTIPEGCTNADLEKLADGAPKGATPKFKGDPDHGGLCIFIMNGTEDDVKEFVASRTWPSPPVFETDTDMFVIPEVPEDGAGSGDGSDAGLMEVDGALGHKNPPSWGLDRVDQRVGLDNAYMPNNEGRGVHVYVVDTGIRTTHVDFEGRAIPTLEVTGATPKPCSPSDTTCAADLHGHGTHCAGTVGGKSYGVAKKAVLHAVKVFRNSGNGQMSWFVEALDWVATSGSRPSVVSASLGSDGNVLVVQHAIRQAVDAGVVVVVAAGNSNADACGFSPAYVPKAITVGATEEGDARAGYSNFGSCIDIFAPGSHIVSAGNADDQASFTASGTSMACPHVSGAAALILSQNMKFQPADVRSAMVQGSSKGKVSDPQPNSPNKFLYVNVPETKK